MTSWASNTCFDCLSAESVCLFSPSFQINSLHSTQCPTTSLLKVSIVAAFPLCSERRKRNKLLICTGQHADVLSSLLGMSDDRRRQNVPSQWHKHLSRFSLLTVTHSLSAPLSLTLSLFLSVTLSLLVLVCVETEDEVEAGKRWFNGP